MEELISKVENWVNKKTNPEQYNFDAKQQAQIELIRAFGGDDMAGTWIDAYARRFDELMNDSTADLVNRLSKKETRAEALEEIKNKLYH